MLLIITLIQHQKVNFLLILTKKIFLITSEFPPLPGGIGNHAYFLSNYLHKSGYDVSILTDFRAGKDDLVLDKEQDFTIYRVKRNKLTQFNRIKKAFTFCTIKSL